MSLSFVTFLETDLFQKAETEVTEAVDQSGSNLLVFRVDGSHTDYYGGSGAFYYEKGMTWEEFVNSDYNADQRFVIVAGGFVAWNYTDSETEQDYERLCEYDPFSNMYFHFFSDSKVSATTFYIGESLPDAE